MVREETILSTSVPFKEFHSGYWPSCFKNYILRLMQDWVAASDLVSYLEHIGYRNNAPFVYVRIKRGALATSLESNQPLKKKVT